MSAGHVHANMLWDRHASWNLLFQIHLWCYMICAVLVHCKTDPPQKKKYACCTSLSEWKQIVLCFSQKKSSRVYFYASFLAYFLGLLLTILVMHFFKHAQVLLLFSFVKVIFCLDWKLFRKYNWWQIVDSIF